ncbi:MAG TPA: hypothetical protein VHD32_05450 [Candidatus Didemnitutus sp.]|nr:hypothetical protein [Candidatus Didemnitutus sp.]
MNRETPAPHFADDEVTLMDIVRRVRRGVAVTLGLTLIGGAVAAAGYWMAGRMDTTTSTMRVVFSFPGFEKGQYPDGSHFQPDDLRAPEIVAEALKRKGFDGEVANQSRIRSALTIEGIIPDSVVRERDRLRTVGQPIRTYVPDEYLVTLALPRSYALGVRDRELLLNEIVSVYQENFVRTYVALPLNFGKAFETLATADYFDYDLVLRRESQNIDDFLTQITGTARSYRSPRTNLSFSDLLKESALFTEIQMNEVLGLIRREGLSRDRKLAMVKMDYYLKTLSDEEAKALEDEKVVRELLQQAQEKQQSYALGIKSQAGNPKPDTTVTVDQGLVDSLLANDSYNFLVHRALDASLNTRRIQAEKAVLQERRASMEAFLKSDLADKADSLGQFQKSYEELKVTYQRLIEDIRKTYEDYQRQQFGDAIRISMQAQTGSFFRRLVMAGIAGAFLGAVLGLGLSLVRTESNRHA